MGISNPTFAKLINAGRFRVLVRKMVIGLAMSSLARSVFI